MLKVRQLSSFLCVPTGNDQDEYGFERGSRKVYELDIGTELGTLQCVKVQQVWPSCASPLRVSVGIRELVNCPDTLSEIPPISVSFLP